MRVVSLSQNMQGNLIMAGKKFTGPLAKPIAKGLSFEEIEVIRREKLDQLAKYYGLPDMPTTDRNELLLWHVTRDHIPGFRIETRGPKRAPVKGTRDRSTQEYQVYAAITTEFKEGTESLKDACTRLSTKSPYRDWGYAAGTLQNMYRNAERKILSGSGIAQLAKRSRGGRHKS